MTTKTANGMTCTGFIVERPDFIKRGWLSTRAEIYVNRPQRVEIKEGRGIEQCKDNPRVFFATENALRKLEALYTIAPDW